MNIIHKNKRDNMKPILEYLLSNNKKKTNTDYSDLLNQLIKKANKRCIDFFRQ